MSGFLAVCVQLSLHKGGGGVGGRSKQVFFVLFVFGFLREFCPRL